MSDNEVDVDGGKEPVAAPEHEGHADEDEDLLYNDLELDYGGGTKVTSVEYGGRKSLGKGAPKDAPPSSATTAPVATTSDVRPYSLVDEVSRLQQQVQQLQTEKQTLQRNMGILYRTAVSEIQRQRDQIESLQLQLLAATCSASAATSIPYNHSRNSDR